jgi:hypothetical protein
LLATLFITLQAGLTGEPEYLPKTIRLLSAASRTRCSSGGTQPLWRSQGFGGRLKRHVTMGCAFVWDRPSGRRERSEVVAHGKP